MHRLAVPTANAPLLRRLAVLSLVLLPLLWLWPCVFGGRAFVSYDLAQFPPVALTSTAEQLAVAQDGANFDVTEVPVWFLPELHLAHDELAAGRLPTWNPHARGGAPLHAHGLIGLCYPPNWLALASSDPEPRLGLVAWLNLALGGLLAFGLLRRVGLSPLPAWFGASLFELSGPMAANALFWMRLGSYVWLPGVLWAVLAIAEAERLRARHVGALGVVFAMTWLAGFPPFAATTTVLGGFVAAWQIVRTAAAGGSRQARALTLRLLLGFAFGGCLALPQVLPSLQFFPHSARETTPTMQTIADQSFESYGLLGFLLPDAFGHPSAVATIPYREQNPLGLLWNTRERDGGPAQPNFNYTEYAVFVGTLGLLLAAFGALAGKHRALPLAAWLLCAGLALFWPLVRLLYHLPVVQNVWPLRWLAPGTLFVCWLAALGLERLRTASWRTPLLLAGIAAALAIVCLRVRGPSEWTQADSVAFARSLATKFHCSVEQAANHVQNGAVSGLDRFAAAQARLAGEAARALPWLCGASLWFLLWALRRDERTRLALALTAAVATALQLGAHGATVTRGAARKQPFDTPVHTFLRERAAQSQEAGGFTICRGSSETPIQSQLPPGQLLVPGIRDLHFYSHFDGRSLQPVQALLGEALGERLAAKGYLTGALPHTLPTPNLALEIQNGARPAETFVTAHPFEHPLLDLLSVRYVLATEALPHTGAIVGPALSGANGAFFVHERPTALPRAFAVAEIVGHADDATVVQALLANDLQPRQRAHALASDLPQPLANTPHPGDARSVRFVVDTPTHVELAVAAGREPWLLLTDTFLPGWTATIDGAEVPVHRADHAFRLVALPAGACTVVFAYRAPGLATGTALAMFAAVAFAVWAFTAAHRERNAAR